MEKWKKPVDTWSFTPKYKDSNTVSYKVIDTRKMNSNSKQLLAQMKELLNKITLKAQLECPPHRYSIRTMTDLTPREWAYEK